LAGGCELEKSYAGPQLEVTDGTYSITQEFIDSMLEWFKNGKALPRRYVWEIVLGCYNELLKEESLTEIVLEQGVTCDIIGDIHGDYYIYI
jgi:serine/threonine-protein phosphatase 5